MAKTSRASDRRRSEAAAKRRTRRDRSDIRHLLIESAAVEFGAHGYEGASTRSIATRADAHQPQINYHFESKLDLWRATVDHLFGLLDDSMTGIEEIEDPGERLAESIRRLVRFAAAHPELNQIMVQEASSPNDRMAWIVERHVRHRFDERRKVWERLRAAGVAAPIEHDVFHYVLVGAASLPYVNAPEGRLLTGKEPTDPERIEAHAESLVTMLLPGLGKRRRRR